MSAGSKGAPVQPRIPAGQSPVGAVLTLRDYFATHAMAAYVAKEGPASDEDGDFVAKYAYEIADAMLTERERTS